RIHAEWRGTRRQAQGIASPVRGVGELEVVPTAQPGFVDDDPVDELRERSGELGDLHAAGVDVAEADHEATLDRFSRLRWCRRRSAPTTTTRQRFAIDLAWREVGTELAVGAREGQRVDRHLA